MLGISLRSLSLGNLTDDIILVVTFVLLITATVMNWLASIHGPPIKKKAHMAASVIATLYIAAYLWFIIGDPDYTKWSSVLRGFSLLAWITVWILPPYLSMRHWYLFRKAVEKRLEEEE